MKDSDIPYKFADAWAVDASGSYITSPIPDTASGGSASQQQGFPPITATPTGSGGIPPNIADFNGVLYYLSAWARWMQGGAPMFYDATFSGNIGGYPNGARLMAASQSHWWQSTVDDNTSNPDAAGANWLNVPFLSGFASATGGVTTSTSLDSTYNGKYLNVGGSSTVQTLPDAGTVTAMCVGFYAVTPCTINTAGGLIAGGVISASSINLVAGNFLCVQSDGTNWRIFSASLASSLLAPNGYRTNSDGTIDQWFQTGIVNTGGGIAQTATVAVPTPFGSAVLAAQICFDGVSPPGPDNPGSISIERIVGDGAHVKVSSNFTNAATLGVNIRLLGY